MSDKLFKAQNAVNNSGGPLLNMAIGTNADLGGIDAHCTIRIIINNGAHTIEKQNIPILSSKIFNLDIDLSKEPDTLPITAMLVNIESVVDANKGILRNGKFMLASPQIGGGTLNITEGSGAYRYGNLSIDKGSKDINLLIRLSKDGLEWNQALSSPYLWDDVNNKAINWGNLEEIVVPGQANQNGIFVRNIPKNINAAKVLVRVMQTDTGAAANINGVPVYPNSGGVQVPITVSSSTQELDSNVISVNAQATGIHMAALRMVVINGGGAEVTSAHDIQCLYNY